MTADRRGAGAIEATDLVLRFGELEALRGISLHARHGEVLALLGPNGAGKTTAIETMEGYLAPDAGSVRVLGHDPRSERAAIAPRLGVMLQEGGLYPDLGPRRALRLWSSYYDDPWPTDDLLERVGLLDVARTPAKRLSGGERQRLSLALALVGHPEVVFLDEPTAGIDPDGRLIVRELVDSLRARGACVVLSTHELAEAEQLADQVVIVDHGRVVASGQLAELVSSYDEVRFSAKSGIDIAAMSEALAAPVEEQAPGEYRVRAGATPGLVASLTAWLASQGIVLADLRAGRQRLEDVYLWLTSDPPSGTGIEARGGRP